MFDSANLSIELLGYAASILVFIAFCMKTLLWLRIVAILSNLAFVGYGVGAGLAPILVLHGVLLPLNLFRLWQHWTVISHLRHACRGNPTCEVLLPFMQPVRAKSGEIIFDKGTPADRLYYVREGTVSIVEFGKTLKVGEIFGEMGLFSEGSLRTATARCETDAKLCQIDRATVLRLFREHPEFGYVITRLVTDRLIENQTSLQGRVADLEGKLAIPAGGHPQPTI